MILQPQEGKTVHVCRQICVNVCGQVCVHVRESVMSWDRCMMHALRNLFSC